MIKHAWIDLLSGHFNLICDEYWKDRRLWYTAAYTENMIRTKEILDDIHLVVAALVLFRHVRQEPEKTGESRRL